MSCEMNVSQRDRSVSKGGLLSKHDMRKHSPLPWSHVDVYSCFEINSSSGAKYFLQVYEVERSRAVKM